jgi:3-oxoacyl-[acyl-carrier protein] reductase
VNSETPLANRVVVVTGGSRGIGREIALTLALAGARIVVAARADSQQLKDTISTISLACGEGRIHPVVADVRRREDCDHVLAVAMKTFGQVDVLFNNAGLHVSAHVRDGQTYYPSFWEGDPDEWSAICDTNIRGAFLMTRAAVPHMAGRRFGKIVNISTNRHTMIRRGGSAYGASKAFLETASRVWADELEESGVTVNVLLPGGPIDTGFHADPSLASKYLPVSVMRAPSVWLASDLSNGHTGQRFVARMWDEQLSLVQRVSRAREDGIEKPMIM